MKRPDYLKGNQFNKSDCQLLFKLRSKMLDVKTNFSNMYNNDVSCRTCGDDGVVEDEEHLLQCKMLKGEIGVDSVVKFDYVFKEIEKQKIAVAAYKAVLRKRTVMLEYQERRL